MSDQSEIRDGIAELARTFSAGDVDAVMAVFDPAPVTFPPGEPRRSGTDAVREWQASVLGQFQVSAHLEAWECEVRDDLAVVSGIYAMKLVGADGAEIRDEGKFVQIWRRQETDAWLLSRNIWNSSAAAE